MNELHVPNFNFHWTLMGGQTFGWDYNPSTEEYIGFTQHSAIKLKVNGDKLYWQTYPQKDNIVFLKRYLRLDFKYDDMLKKISKDGHIKNAVNNYPNLRILQQDFEENLLSFIISANNNIKSIRKSIRNMNQKWGEKVDVDGIIISLFPSTEAIANAPINELLECRLGFHAKFLKGVAVELKKSNLKNKISFMSEEEARNILKSMNGVGDKIADCVLIYSLGFDNVTPLDVWGKRILTQFYNINSNMRYADMRQWVDTYFEGYAGWAGQFLFEYIRNVKEES